MRPLDDRALQAILRRYPKDGRGFFSKSEIIRGYRFLRSKGAAPTAGEDFVERLRMKPVRTQSGVTPVTVLTKPYPCPGRCVFCPSDVRMPKSYLSDEPGAQRAAEHQFDPWAQTTSRLLTYHNTGHPVDKVELIVLGGTWSSYPESYQRWFVARCFEALNEFSTAYVPDLGLRDDFDVDYRQLARRHPRGNGRGRYNEIVARFTEGIAEEKRDDVSWRDLNDLQRRNETAQARCVGLVLETRPDAVDLDEVLRLRRLGATKIQIGYQSLDDEILRLNQRGHDVDASKRATKLLRCAGFKIHGHWMPNLYGSSPERDRDDFERLWSDPALRPDELKVYPCSLLESSELMEHYEAGRWRPYGHEELLSLLAGCLAATPRYCRITRMIRDIPGTDIVDGNRVTNLRELAEERADALDGGRSEIRSREVRDSKVRAQKLELRDTRYATSVGEERFLEWVDGEDRLAGFLRLSLPDDVSPVGEIAESAVVREVHVYGSVVGIGDDGPGRAQHSGLGSRLLEEARRIAKESGYADLAVISSVGTREYYRARGYVDGELYQHRSLDREPA